MKRQAPYMKEYLVDCIESHLGWGKGDSWTNKDFDELSARILKVTGKQLSVTTLKRVWGRAASVSNPSATTFDILSEFLGFEDWRDFQQAQNIPRSEIVSNKKSSKFWKISAATVVLLTLVLLFWQGKEKSEVEESRKIGFFQNEDISFSFEKVSTGYPNTVIFKYDVGNLSYDSLSIQQSWDKTRRIPLKESKGLMTSTYYIPGYFLAKLVANDTILVERDLYIPTNGWQAILVGASKELKYVKPEKIRQSETSLTIDSEVLDEMESMENGKLSLAHLSPKPKIDGHNFTLETSFKLARPKEQSICQNVRMTLTGTREVISLAFSIPGCVGDLSFFIDKEMISGRNHDFSGFGMNSEEWTNCTLRVENDLLRVFIADNEVFTKELKVDLGKIGGVKWSFEGLGEIRKLTLQDEEHKLDLLD